MFDIVDIANSIASLYMQLASTELQLFSRVPIEKSLGRDCKLFQRLAMVYLSKQLAAEVKYFLEFDVINSLSFLYIDLYFRILLIFLYVVQSYSIDELNLFVTLDFCLYMST
jgi:hypothetical protein